MSDITHDSGEDMGPPPPPPPPPPDDVPSSTASAAAGGLPSDILEMVDRAIVYAGSHSGKVMILCRYVKGSSWADRPLEELIPVVEYWHAKIPDSWKRGDMRYVEDVVTRFYESYPETKYGMGRNTKSEVTERAAEMLDSGQLPDVAKRFQDPVKQAIATLCWVWQRTVWQQNGGGDAVPFGLSAKDLTEFVFRHELAEITDAKERAAFIDEHKDAIWNIISRTFTRPPYAILQLVVKGEKWQKGVKSKSTTWLMPCAIPGLGEST